MSGEKDALSGESCIDWMPTTEPYGWCSCGATVKRGDWIEHRQAHPTQPVEPERPVPEPVVYLDARTHMPIAVSTPCPSRVIAHLGMSTPAGTELPCGLLAGHEGPHTYHIEWVDPGSPTLPREDPR